MADGDMGFNDDQRRAIGSLADGMRRLVDELHRFGVGTEVTLDVERQIAALERATGATSVGGGDPVRATLSELWVLSCELRAKSLRGYGALGERESALLDEHAKALERSVRRLEEHVRQRGG